LALAAIYLSRVRVVGSVFAAALTVLTVVLPPAVAARIKKRKKAVVYNARRIMPRAGARAGATGDTGGAAGSKVRSTEAQTNNREWPANDPLLVGF
jgi:hypothetical protein